LRGEFGHRRDFSSLCGEAGGLATRVNDKAILRHLRGPATIAACLILGNRKQLATG
jgi:hypothetical protein